MTTLWDVLRRKFPREIHLRIKRYSMEEVLQDSNWLFKKWAEKDRLLSQFARQQQFPGDTRDTRPRVFATRQYNLESSILALMRLLLLPCAIPFLLLLSFPLFWLVLWIWLGHNIYRMVTGEKPDERPRDRTPGSASAPDTPFFPATPFVSPSPLRWRDMFDNNNDNNR